MSKVLTYSEFPFDHSLFLEKGINARDLHVTLYDEMGCTKDGYQKLSEVNRRVHNAAVKNLVGKFAGDLGQRVTFGVSRFLGKSKRASPDYSLGEVADILLATGAYESREAVLEDLPQFLGTSLWTDGKRKYSNSFWTGLQSSLDVEVKEEWRWHGRIDPDDGQQRVYLHKQI